MQYFVGIRVFRSATDVNLHNYTDQQLKTLTDTRFVVMGSLAFMVDQLRMRGYFRVQFADMRCCFAMTVV